MIIRAVAFALLVSCAACDYEPPDRGQPQRVGQDRTGAALAFGNIERVEGTRFFTIPIVRADRRGGYGSFSKYGGDDQRNRLIVDSTTGASRKVLPNADFEIVNWMEPTDAASRSENLADGDSKPSSVGIYAAVVKRPGAKEKDHPTYDLLFGRFEDGQQAWVARGLAGVESVWLTPDRKLAVVAATPKAAIYRLYDPASFKQVLESPLNL